MYVVEPHLKCILPRKIRPVCCQILNQSCVIIDVPVSVQGVRVLAAAGRKFHRTKFNEVELITNSKRHIGHTCYMILLLFTLPSGWFDYDLHLRQL